MDLLCRRWFSLLKHPTDWWGPVTLMGPPLSAVSSHSLFTSERTSSRDLDRERCRHGHCTWLLETRRSLGSSTSMCRGGGGGGRAFLYMGAMK